MDQTVQEIVRLIGAAEVQRLMVHDGVQHASFGQAVADGPNGDMLAHGYISEISIGGWSEKTKRTTPFDRRRRWDADVTINYTIIQEFMKMDGHDEEFSSPPIQAVNDLREKFRAAYPP